MEGKGQPHYRGLSSPGHPRHVHARGQPHCHCQCVAPGPEWRRRGGGFQRGRRKIAGGHHVLPQCGR
eukprot:9363478-Prorocentrum_lima.AAC.1